MKLIGHKNEFAVEYQITDISSMMGYGKLWIQDEFYGTNEDLIYLRGYLEKLLNNIIDAEPFNLTLDYSNSDLIFEQFRKLSNETSKYLIPSSTFTDDFIGYKFRDGQYVVLVWKIRSDIEMIFDDLKNYTTSTIIVKVKHEIVKKVMNDFKEEIKKASV